MIINIKKLNYQIKDKVIINNLDLSIPNNQLLAITGYSGSGKSTLLRLIGDLISKTSGEIYYADKLQRDYNPQAYRRLVSYCLQLPTLFGEKVIDNFTFVYDLHKEAYDEAKVLSLMHLFNLDKSMLEQSNHDLSGGEKQRIALIRSLLFLPKVLLLDEISASLDYDNTMIVEKAIRQLHQDGLTILLVTHDLAQAKRLGERIVTLDKGQIIKDEVNTYE